MRDRGREQRGGRREGGRQKREEEREIGWGYIWGWEDPKDQLVKLSNVIL